MINSSIKTPRRCFPLCSGLYCLTFHSLSSSHRDTKTLLPSVLVYIAWLSTPYPPVIETPRRCFPLSWFILPDFPLPILQSSRHQDAASLCPGLYCLTFHSLSSSHRDTKTLLPSVLVYIAWLSTPYPPVIKTPRRCFPLFWFILPDFPLPILQSSRHQDAASLCSGLYCLTFHSLSSSHQDTKTLLPSVLVYIAWLSTPYPPVIKTPRRCFPLFWFILPDFPLPILQSSRHQDAASLCSGLYCLTFHSLSSSHQDTKTLLPSVLVYIAWLSTPYPPVIKTPRRCFPLFWFILPDFPLPILQSSRHQDAASLCSGLYCLTFHSLSSSHQDTKTLLPSVLVYIAWLSTPYPPVIKTPRRCFPLFWFILPDFPLPILQSSRHQDAASLCSGLYYMTFHSLSSSHQDTKTLLPSVLVYITWLLTLHYPAIVL